MGGRCALSLPVCIDRGHVVAAEAALVAADEALYCILTDGNNQGAATKKDGKDDPIGEHPGIP